MRISAPGSSARRRTSGDRGAARGFTLIELMVVVAIIAIVSALASMALRDPAASKLEHEAVRLTALLESARADARASGIAARWEPLTQDPEGAGFRFIGVPVTDPMPTHWLEPRTTAQVIGSGAIVLGPEPLIGAQRIVLSLDDQRLTLATDGLGPFVVTDNRDPAP